MERLGEGLIPGPMSPEIEMHDDALWDLLQSELHPGPGRRTGRAAWRPDGAISTLSTQPEWSICEFFCPDAYSRQPGRGNDPARQT